MECNLLKPRFAIFQYFLSLIQFFRKNPKRSSIYAVTMPSTKTQGVGNKKSMFLHAASA